MLSLKTTALVGTASLLLAGAAGIAWAEAPHSHMLTLQLPNGAVEQIQYSGTVAPRVTLTPVTDAAVANGLVFTPLAPVSFFDSAFGDASPFALFDRIAAQMQMRTQAMAHEAAMLGAFPAGNEPTWVNWGALPAGSSRYSMVSTSSGNGICTQSVQITARGDGKAPQVVRQSSGDCGSGATSAPALLKQAPAAPSGVTRTSLKVDADADAAQGHTTT